MDAFYLNIPEERNARIHELHVQTLNFKNEDIATIINKAKQTNAYIDLNKLKQFDINMFNNVSKEKKIEFVDFFHKILNDKKAKYNVDLNINYPKEPDKFFDYWINQFHINGEKSIKRALQTIYSAKNK